MTTLPRLSQPTRALTALGVMSGVLLGMTACLIPLGGEQTGEIRVGWNFADDASCASLGVDTVSVQAIGEERGGGLDVDCVEGSALVPELPSGTYDIFIDAVGTNARFSAREQIEVEAGFTSDEGVVKLSPSVGPEGTSLALSWTFGGDPSCARTGVTTVDIIVHADDDIAASRSIACTEGGTTLDGLPTGTVSVELLARGEDGLLYQATTDATLGVFTRELGVVDLAPVRARMRLTWSFEGDPRCEIAGVADVSVQVIDDAGATVGGAITDCLEGGVDFAALPAEHLTFVVEGLTGVERIWQSSAATDLVAGDNPPLAVSLDPTFARVTVRWLFADAAGTGDCATAGVSLVTVQVFDAAGDAVTGASFPCAQGAGTFTRMDAGAHRFVADGFSVTGVLVASDTTGSPRGVTQTLAVGDNDVDVTLE